MNSRIIWAIVVAMLLLAAYLVGLKMGKESSIVPDDVNETISQQTLFVPAGWRRMDDYTIVIDVAVLPGELRSIWVEYGLTAATITEKTAPTSEELGMGTAGQYGSYSITIPHADLQPGRSYFYLVAAETESGEIMRTALNQFTAGK